MLTMLMEEEGAKRLRGLLSELLQMEVLAFCAPNTVLMCIDFVPWPFYGPQNENGPAENKILGD